MQTIYLLTITRDHDFGSVAHRQAFTSRRVAERFAYDFIAKAVEADDAHDPTFGAFAYSMPIVAIDLDETEA